MKKKIFTVVCHRSYDYEIEAGAASFSTMEKAQSAMKEYLSNWDKKNPSGFGEYTQRDIYDTNIAIYEEGDYSRNHIEWTIFEDEVEFDEGVFQIPYMEITRQDVEDKGFDASNISDEEMETIANYMSKYIQEWGGDYQDALKDALVNLGFTRKDN